MSIRRFPNFANPEGSQVLPIRRGPIFVNPEGYYFLSKLKKTKECKVVKDFRFIRDRLGTSDCTGNLPFVKKESQNKTGLNSDIRDTKSKLIKNV